MQQNEAMDIMKMGYNVFLTGEAGTGKTYVLKKYIHFLSSKHIPTAITASTGIAATHLNGVTIDSWSGLGLHDDITEADLRRLDNKRYLKKRLVETKVLIIDEISMIAGQRFSAVDKIIRYIRGNNQVFGGLQVILCGDLFQLPPVTNNRHNIDFIFKSKSWQELDLRICYLSTPRRQTDPRLLKLLSDIRHSQVTQTTINSLEQIIQKPVDLPFVPTKLYTHNIDVDAINQQELAKNDKEPHYYYMSVVGNDKLVEMLKRSCLSPEKLELKKGALVMFVRNNYGKGYVNGTLGKVIGFNHDNDPVVETLGKQKITVTPAAWSIEENNKTIAQITQVPLRLAWAITVHKSQGMTLDAAEIDLSKSFMEGMGYVALSRVKSLKGLRLIGLNSMALKVHGEISKIDKYLIALSAQTVFNLKKLGWIKRYIKRWKFMYKLTSK